MSLHKAVCLGFILILASSPVRSQEISRACYDIQAGASTDNVNFTLDPQPVLTGARAPTALMRRDGQWLYWADAADGLRLRTPDGHRYQVLVDQQIADMAHDAQAVATPDGGVRLYYRKGDGIQLADSRDGINFTHRGVALAVPGVSHPSVVALPGGGWLMAAGLDGQKRTVLAKSADGLTFTPTGTEFEAESPELQVLDHHKLRLLTPILGGVSSQMSSDGGASWKREPGLRLRAKRPLSDVTVARLGQYDWRLYVAVEKPCP